MQQQTYYCTANRLPYLYVLYQFDCLSVAQVAYLLGAAESVAARYLRALRDDGYAKDIKVDRKQYWHIVTNGIQWLGKVINAELPITHGSLNPRKTTKNHAVHDLTGTLAIMQFIENTIENGRGVISWLGPTLTKTLYPRQLDKAILDKEGNVIGQRPMMVSTYNPDAYVEVFLGDRWGSMNIEIDSGTQHLPILSKKVEKCRQGTVVDNFKSNSNWQTIAFITKRNKWRILDSVVEQYVDHPNPILVICATVDEILTYGPYERIWGSNMGTHDLYDLSEILINPWESSENPLLIGTQSWRETLREGELYLHSPQEPFVTGVRPWERYIKFKEQYGRMW
ncbi:hypothetical protein D3C78_20690 [compost metagenome]